MAQLTAITTFKHGHETYEEGQTYDVPDVLAGYFVANGWADADDPALMEVITGTPAHVALEVDNAVHESSTTDG